MRPSFFAPWAPVVIFGVMRMAFVLIKFVRLIRTSVRCPVVPRALASRGILASTQAAAAVVTIRQRRSTAPPFLRFVSTMARRMVSTRVAMVMVATMARFLHLVIILALLHELRVDRVVARTPAAWLFPIKATVKAFAYHALRSVSFVSTESTTHKKSAISSALSPHEIQQRSFYVLAEIIVGAQLLSIHDNRRTMCLLRRRYIRIVHKGRHGGVRS